MTQCILLYFMWKILYSIYGTLSRTAGNCVCFSSPFLAINPSVSLCEMGKAYFAIYYGIIKSKLVFGLRPSGETTVPWPSRRGFTEESSVF